MLSWQLTRSTCGASVRPATTGGGFSGSALRGQHPAGISRNMLQRQLIVDVSAKAGKKSGGQKKAKPQQKARAKKAAPANNKAAADADEAYVELPLPDYETSDICPCGSGATYESCCEKFIYGDAQPSTCEELMRSRYSAFAKRETKYVVATTHPEHNEIKDLSETELIQDVAATAKNCSFHKLAVLENCPGESADEGEVEFRLWFKFVQYKGKKVVQGEDWRTLTETSTFKKKDGRWMYVSGETDFTSMPYGDAGPIPAKDKAAAGLANVASKAKEQAEQAKAALADIGDFTSAADGMKKVFGLGKKK